ncbi:unnamed protein product [Prorocentrum cordatum]|uniref:USP domain-containing protein n=1 Tax=Prorocentrum cordatum TaxID=2364126 RepID=A0ABN9QFB1_9DINO|nr:unnamed protein product [Polarella glacialis]
MAASCFVGVRWLDRVIARLVSRGFNPAFRSFRNREGWDASGVASLRVRSIQRFRCYSGKYEKSKLSVAVPACLDLEEFVLSHAQLKSLAPACVRADDGTADGLSINSLLERLQREGSVSSHYELYALCEHRGDEMQKGHYVAYVNNGPSLAKEQWFGLSDAKVWKCDRAEVLRAEAYIVFYRRQGTMEREGAVGAEGFESEGVPGGTGPAESAAT